MKDRRKQDFHPQTTSQDILLSKIVKGHLGAPANFPYCWLLNERWMTPMQQVFFGKRTFVKRDASTKISNFQTKR